jgi:hypothetical protein
MFILILFYIFSRLHKMEDETPPSSPPPSPPRLKRCSPIYRSSKPPRSSTASLASLVTSCAVDALLRCPSDSFPHLLAGLSLQLTRKQVATSTAASAATGGEEMLETVFLIVSHTVRMFQMITFLF